VFIHLYIAFYLHNDHSVDRLHLGQVIMSDGIWAKLSICTKYFGKHRTPAIRGIMKYGCFISLLWNNFVNYNYFKMRVLTWRHYTRAARVVSAVMSLHAKYARAEVMPIDKDPVFCGRNAPCRKRLIYMYHCAFHWNSLRWGLSQSVNSNWRGSPGHVFVFCTFFFLKWHIMWK